jgi:hypothetical protein
MTDIVTNRVLRIEPGAVSREERCGRATFAALHNINVTCCRHEARWVLRAGRRLCRLLQICDPDGSLPLIEARSTSDDGHAGARDRQLLVGRNN